MKAIYKLNIETRGGNIEGIFTADTQEMEDLISSGKELYFGEVLGKHSNVKVVLEPDYISLVSCDPAHVMLFEQLDMETGHNPFDYIEDEDTEDY